jgi:hypothetical protein
MVSWNRQLNIWFGYFPAKSGEERDERKRESLKKRHARTQLFQNQHSAVTDYLTVYKLSPNQVVSWNRQLVIWFGYFSPPKLQETEEREQIPT